jgi:hypothetical protein
MQSLHAQHTYGIPTSPALPSSLRNVSCDACLLNKASAAPRNKLACSKPPRPHINMSSGIWGHVNVPSPHGMRCCLLVIDHHTNYMWVGFLKSKDDIATSWILSSLKSVICTPGITLPRVRSHLSLNLTYTLSLRLPRRVKCAVVWEWESNSLRHTLITCLVKRSVLGAQFETTLLP